MQTRSIVVRGRCRPPMADITPLPWMLEIDAATLALLEEERRIVGGLMEDLAAALILEALDARDRKRRSATVLPGPWKPR
jgi:hypothetical protein